MYPRSKFQEVLLEIREEMAREADFDVDLFAEMVRSGQRRGETQIHKIVENGETDKTGSKPAKPYRRKAAS